MKKVMVVFGTRPEAIKMAPLCHRLREQKDIETIICVTAQHREMLDQVLSIFKLTPDIDLSVMKKGQDLYDVTSNILLKMRDTLKEEKPDIVLKANEILGEMGVIDMAPRMATAKALEESVIIFVSTKEFEKKLEDSDMIIRGVMAILSERLRDIQKRR